MFDDMERVNTDDCLFEIDRGDIFVGFVHVNTNEFNIEEFMRGL